jgi:SAM-dependent methyltransferase
MVNTATTSDKLRSPPRLQLDGSANKKELEREFYARIPKARRINPVFRALFEFMYQAHLDARPGTKLLNLYASQDFSGNREEIYRDRFFNECEYAAIDFWRDHFILDGKPTPGAHELPFDNDTFNTVVTTKHILEHVSEPEKVIRELHRVLKPGGHAYVIAPHIRRQHQKPYDYFRYTEYALEYLFKKAGYAEFTATPTGGALATFASYGYFFERGLGAPKMVERFFDGVHKWVMEPVLYTLDRLDNGYGRDFTQFFLVRARK